jgi:hypothetical protein
MRSLRKGCLCLVLLLLTWIPPAQAVLCGLDDVPAATLLLPYFEVDLDRPTTNTTLFSVINTAPDAALAKIVLWSDMGVPTLNFNIYLTGYDVLTVNLADIFRGQIPQTGLDLVPAGDFSRPNVQFPGCEDQLPTGNLPNILIEHIEAAHTGGASPLDDQCYGVDHADRIARGYLTVDVVNACSLLFPDQPGYFGPDGVIGHDNVLMGDFYFVNADQGFAQGENLVRIESDPTAFGEGDYTFYARFVSADGSDGREPLATTWAVRYAVGGAFDGGTELIGWRDTKAVLEPFACEALPSPGTFPLKEMSWIFDEDENPYLVESPPIPGLPPAIPRAFPAAVWRTIVGGPQFPVGFDFGWIQFNFNDVEGDFLPPFSQAWVGSLTSAAGLYSVGLGATALNSACDPESLVLPLAGNVAGLPPGNP